jgi:hypothetical protein
MQQQQVQQLAQLRSVVEQELIGINALSALLTPGDPPGAFMPLQQPK